MKRFGRWAADDQELVFGDLLPITWLSRTLRGYRWPKHSSAQEIEPGSSPWRVSGACGAWSAPRLARCTTAGSDLRGPRPRPAPTQRQKSRQPEGPMTGLPQSMLLEP
jgi:hypothetical protein